MKYLGSEQVWLKAVSAGAAKDGLSFEAGPWAGDGIEDGVAFAVPGKFEGALVVSFSDFEEMYEAARRARGLREDKDKIIVQPQMTIDLGQIAEMVGVRLASELWRRGVRELNTEDGGDK